MIPSIFLLLIASTIWSPSPVVLIVLLAVFGWASTCRLIRGEVLSVSAIMCWRRGAGRTQPALMMTTSCRNVISTDRFAQLAREHLF